MVGALLQRCHSLKNSQRTLAWVQANLAWLNWLCTQMGVEQYVSMPCTGATTGPQQQQHSELVIGPAAGKRGATARVSVGGTMTRLFGSDVGDDEVCHPATPGIHRSFWSFPVVHLICPAAQSVHVPSMHFAVHINSWSLMYGQ